MTKLITQQERQQVLIHDIIKSLNRRYFTEYDLLDVLKTIEEICRDLVLEEKKAVVRQIVEDCSFLLRSISCFLLVVLEEDLRKLTNDFYSVISLDFASCFLADHREVVDLFLDYKLEQAMSLDFSLSLDTQADLSKNDFLHNYLGIAVKRAVNLSEESLEQVLIDMDKFLSLYQVTDK